MLGLDNSHSGTGLPQLRAEPLDLKQTKIQSY